MILRLRMLSDENDNFVRDFEVSHEMNLLELHNFIIASIGYDDCMASFYSADDQWQPLQEFSLMDLGEEQFEGAPMAMEKVTLAELVVSECNRLIYQFDMIADRAFYLEVVSATQPNPELEYPRVSFENARVPDQYDPDAVPADDGSIFDEIMDEFGEFDGDDSYDDEY
ncbi:MAG: hypothetical protein J6K33_09165 [Alistipes sp.]|nr:hypothetical protein [Alistipes sp.]